MTWWLPRVAVLAAALVIVGASVPEAMARQQTSTAVDGGATREAAIEQRDETVAALEALQTKLLADEEALTGVRREREALASRIVQLEGQVELNRIARVETAEALIDPRRQQADLAVEIYVSGEPTLNAVLSTVRTGRFDSDRERERVIFSTVRRRILDRIDELETTSLRLDRVAADLETVRVRAIDDRTKVEEAVVDAQQTLEADRLAAQTLRADLSELERLIASLPLPTTTLVTGQPLDGSSSVVSEAGPDASQAATATATTLAGPIGSTTREAATAASETPTSGSSTTPSSVSASTTSTERELPFRHLLTGVPTDIVTRRPALAVKIDNAGNARPQAGLNQADVVFEEIVEGGRTRFVAIFQSTQADPIGPIRSARTSDLHILSNLNSPLFANSGANPGTLGLIAQSSLTNVNVNRASGAYFRSSGRRAPHNLYSRTSSLWNAAPASAGVPPEMFLFRPRGFERPNSGRSIARVSVDFGAETVSYGWNGQGWERTAGGRASVDSAGIRIAPANVIVQFIEYGQSPIDARSPEARVIGSGSAWVLTAGRLIAGSWHRPAETDVTTYLDADGEPILLEPGSTWIALPTPGAATVR